MNIKSLTAVLAMIVSLAAHAIAQTTAFNFQGRLNDGTNPANGRYDLQFKLFPAITGGAQVGSTVDRPNLLLINGVFTTTLDFGATAFPGGSIFIEISVRPNGSTNSHVVLGARQQILSAPYSIRSAYAGLSNVAYSSDFALLAQDSNNLGGHISTEYARLDFANPGSFQATEKITSASVGIGTQTPNTKLTINGGPSWTSANWTASMNMQNASAIGWEANASGQRFGIGQTNGGLYFFRTTNPFGSNSAPAQSDLTITDSGNIAQPIERNGMMKAMLAVTADGIIVRCYNGVTGSTTGNCGFSVTVQKPPLPLFLVDFPFDVSNRFWLVTPERSDSGIYPQTAGVQLIGSNGLVVETHYDGTAVNKPFHLFVF